MCKSRVFAETSYRRGKFYLFCDLPISSSLSGYVAIIRNKGDFELV